MTTINNKEYFEDYAELAEEFFHKGDCTEQRRGIDYENSGCEADMNKVARTILSCKGRILDIIKIIDHQLSEEACKIFEEITGIQLNQKIETIINETSSNEKIPNEEKPISPNREDMYVLTDNDGSYWAIKTKDGITMIWNGFNWEDY